MPYKVNYTDTPMANMGDFEQMPNGVYMVEIEKTEERRSKKNYPMINIRYKIIDKEFKGRKLFDNICLIPPGCDGAGIAKYFLKLIDQPHEGEVIVYPDQWIGKKLNVKVEWDEKYRNYKIKNRVKWEEAPF